VPDYARLWYYVRENNREKVEQNYAWVLDIAAGAARATRTRFEVTLITGVHERLLNRPLQEVAQRNFEWVGGPPFDRADQAFAKELQKSLEIDRVGLATQLEPLADQSEPVEGGSTDVAEVSWIAPTVSIQVASAGRGVPWHNWATSASHGIPGAAKSAQTAARVLALTGVDLLTDPDLMARAKADFRTRTGGKPYVSPIPKDQKPPLPEKP
jgi:aminobenzoyl-glutamate utilization protein B